MFGGIYRPVWLEAKPQIRIEHIAVDAKMDGEMQLYTELKGVKGKEKLTAALHPLDGTDVCSEVGCGVGMIVCLLIFGKM